MTKTLGGFHQRLAQRITVKLLWIQANRSWHYPPLVYAMIMAGLEELDKYISRRQNMVAQYISTCPIMDIFLEADKFPGHGW